jgi:hypothetical protein
VSRLHAQKRRLRALQRAEGIIAPDADQIDRAAVEELGTAHEQIEAAEDSPLDQEKVHSEHAVSVPRSGTLKLPKKKRKGGKR